MSSVKAFFRLIVPRIPLMFSTAFLHALSMTENAKRWDLLTDVVINVLRSILEHSKSTVTKQQEFGMKDPGIKGPMWVSKASMPKPAEDDVRQALFQIIAELNHDGTETYTKPELAAVSGEWFGPRAGATAKSTLPDISEEEKYSNLAKELTSDLTVLYFHGGAYYMMDPCSHRGTTGRLAKETGGRVFSVRYRLAPQNPFPAAILDALVAYLSVLYPPAGSTHAAAKPENVVFAGDSAGGNMALVLCLTILQFNKTRQTLRFNGQDVALPLPGGTAPSSPWCDVTRALPSLVKNHRYDYLPVPEYAMKPRDLPDTQDPIYGFPCELWPGPVPRADVYCDGPALAHPLVSPAMAPVEMWAGMPPVYMCMGEEMIADEGRVVAARIVRAGGQVRFDGFEALPHCFALALHWLPQTKRNFDGWARFMREVVDKKFAVEGLSNEGDEARFEGKWIHAKTNKETPVKFADLTDLTDDEVSKLIRNEMQRRNGMFDKLQAARNRQAAAGEKARL